MTVAGLLVSDEMACAWFQRRRRLSLIIHSPPGDFDCDMMFIISLPRRYATA